MACGILVPQPGIELTPPAVEAQYPGAATTEPTCLRAQALPQEKPPSREAQASQLESSPRFP